MKEIIGVVSGSFLVLALLLSSCKPLKSDIDLVRIFYLPQNMSVMTAIDSCDKIFDYSEFLKDTIIKDNYFIENLSNQIEMLSTLSDSLNVCDIRIRCVLKDKKGNKKILCLGEYFGTIYEGIPMNDNRQLRKLIKDAVYK